MKPIQTRRPSGFTLIELLVVIAIIAILAAILFPVFAQAREKARQASCMSNLKQQSLGILQYTQDFDEAYPAAQMSYNGLWSNGFAGMQLPCNASNEQSSDCMAWGNSVQPYMKSYGVMKCPDAILDYQPYGPNPTGSSYTYNGALQFSTQGAVVSPTVTVMLWSGLQGYTWEGRTWSQPLLNCEGSPSTTPCVYKAGNSTGNGSNEGYSFYYFSGTGYVHGKGDNYAYCDGHVKYCQMDLSQAHDPFGCRDGRGDEVVNNAYYCPTYSTSESNHTCLFSLDNACNL